VAGLTTAAVVIPKALGYATVAGLPIQVGLYTVFVPMVVYAFLGSSPVLSVSTSSTLAILTAAVLQQTVPGGAADSLLQVTAALTLLAGAALMLAALLRLGFIANFISEPVLVGFKAGIAVVIILDQLPKVLGIHIVKGSFLTNVAHIVLGLPHLSLPTAVVGGLTIVGLLLLEAYRPQWPAPLIAVALAIAAVLLLHLDAQGVALVGAVPSGLPPFTLPDVSLAPVLWPSALGIALMSFTETAAAGRAFARSDEAPPRPNVELFATGVANAAGAFLGAMPGGGGTSQTAVNCLTGARTKLAGFVTGVVSLLTMLLLSPLIALMPHAVLAGIVIVYSVGLIKPVDFRTILAIRRTEFFWALVALVGVISLGTLRGILVAIIVSLVSLAQQTANPPVYVLGRKPGTNIFRPQSSEHAGDETFPGLLLLRLGGRVFFLNVERLGEKIRPLIADMHPRVVAMDLGGVFDLEYSALKMLTEAEQRQREAGVMLWLVGLSPAVLATIQRSPLGATLGRERLIFDLETAVRNFQRLHR
jgi:high affinity sulfate transporter 1